MKNKWYSKVKKITSAFMMLQLFVGLFAPGIAFANITSLTVTSFTTSNYMTPFGGTFVDPDNNDNVQISVGGYISDPAVITVDHTSDTWSFSGVALSEGPNLITATAVNSGVVATGTITVDTTVPNLNLVTPVVTPTSDSSPSFTFNSNEAGGILYGGDCGGSTFIATVGDNTVDLLTDGTNKSYDNCTITVVDSVGNSSLPLSVSSFVVDTTGPTLDSLGLKSWSNLDSTEVPVAGDLSTGWNLDRDGEATTDYYLDFSDVTVSNEPIALGYYPLTLTDMNITAVELMAYYSARGVPEPFLTYLNNAANGAAPFAYIMGDGTNHPTLIDAAKHDLLGLYEPMTIPGDFLEGEYTVSGTINDTLGNASVTYDYKLIVGDITAPVISNLSTVSSPTSNTTPTFSFDSDEEGTLNLTGTGCSVSSAAVTEGTNYFTFDVLSEGTYNCSVTVTDESDNISNSLSLNEFVVDTTMPSTAYAITGGTTGDAGWYKGSTPPTITLSSEATATIYWQWESEGWNSGSTDQNPPVSEGVRTLEYYSIDSATNEETPHQSVTIKYDGTNPVAGDGGVIPMKINGGANWTNTNLVDVYSYSVSDSQSGFDRLMLSNDNVNYSLYDWANPYVGWTLSGSDGIKTVYFKVVDVAGNESVVYSDTIKMDRVAPTVTNVEVLDKTNTPFVNYYPFVKGDVDNRVRADVSDDYAGIKTTTCEYTLDGGTNWYTGTYNTTTLRCIADISGIADGTPLAVNVRVQDRAGNYGEGEVVYLTADSAGPAAGTIEITPVYNDFIAATVEVEADFSDTVSGVSGCEFRYWYDGSWSDWVSTNWNSTDGECELNFGGLEHNRIYQIEMRATDNIGHVSEALSTGPKFVDGMPPTVEYVDPTPTPDLLTSQNSQTFKIDTDDDVTSCSIDLGLGTGDFESGDLSGWSTGGNALWRISTDTVNGAYSAQSGNMWGWNAVQSWISREIDVPSNTNITFWQKVNSEGGWDYLRFYIDGNQYSAISGWRDWHQVSFPISAGHHTITWNYTKDWSVTAGTDSGNIDNIVVGGVALGLSDQSMTSNGDGTWTYGPVTLPDGPRNYTTTCVDHVGNTTTTENRTLTVDTTAPTVPGVPVDNKNNPTNQKWVTWNWDASTDLYSGINRYEWVIEKDEVEVASGTVAGDVTSKSKSLAWGDGDYVFKVRAVDGLGNTSEYSVSEILTLDQTDPVAPVLDWPNDPYYTQSQTNTFFWYSVEDAYRYRIEFCAEDPGDEGVACNNVIDEKMGITNTYKTYTFGSSDMDVWWRVRTRDEAGNLSPWGESRKVVIDNTAPVSSVDTLAQYINTEKFNINVTATDDAPSNFLQITEEPTLTQGSGVNYVELWYRKDKTDVEVADSATLAAMPTNGYTKYCGGMSEAAVYAEGTVVDDSSPCRFDPTQPIEFDTSLTGGDGFYEFYSIAVDNAGNQEMVPMTEVSGVDRLVEEETIIESEVLPDTSTTVDTKSPVITLIGSNPLTVTQGTTFTDPGASTDDGTAVFETGSVDTNSVGSYLRYYDATDLAGNKATQVTRNVNVVAAAVSPLAATIIGEEGGDVQGAVDENQEPEKEVKGTEDNKDESEDETSGAFLGLMWYWWILILAGLGIGYWWFIGGKRRRDEK